MAKARGTSRSAFTGAARPSAADAPRAAHQRRISSPPPAQSAAPPRHQAKPPASARPPALRSSPRNHRGSQHGLPSVQLRKPLERVVAHGHPWVYRDALHEHTLDTGAVVDILDQRGLFLARGLIEAGPIGVRVLTREAVAIDQEFWQQRIERALALRETIVPAKTDAYRLIHGEGDGLPGIVCDRYGPYAVLALDGEAVLVHQAAIVPALSTALQRCGVSSLLRRHGRGPQRTLEVVTGELPPTEIIVHEHGMRLVVDLLHGQKTGLFLDHRESRWRTRQLVGKLKEARVLNLYGYTGGFSVAAGLGGAAHVTTVDLAKPAIAMAERSWLANDLPAHHHGIACDAEAFLDQAVGQDWDLVIADPPSFAPNERSVTNALRAYKAMHAGALACVRDGGYYLTASCSSHITREAFETSLREAAHQRKINLQVVDRWAAGADHPSALGFPQGDYLCVTLCRRV